ncbi:hypothetical protein DFH09DRAFT_864666, partial [Mycena vulgaris]
DVPPVMLLYLDHDRLTFDPVLSFDVAGQNKCMKLKGIIYGGHGHFTCRVIGLTGAMWYNDGMTTGRQCIQEVNIGD